jgi:hypothetical protein
MYLLLIILQGGCENDFIKVMSSYFILSKDLLASSKMGRTFSSSYSHYFLNKIASFFYVLQFSLFISHYSF